MQHLDLKRNIFKHLQTEIKMIKGIALDHDHIFKKILGIQYTGRNHQQSINYCPLPRYATLKHQILTRVESNNDSTGFKRPRRILMEGTSTTQNPYLNQPTIFFSGLNLVALMFELTSHLRGGSQTHVKKNESNWTSFTKGENIK